jgi:hypothetical protein
MLEFLFEVAGEFLLQIVLEVLVEFGFHAIKEPLRKRPEPWLAAVGYLLFGVILGGLSLLVVANHWVASKALRVANLVLTPIAAGGFMSLLGAWRARRGQAVLRIDRFAYGYLFALGVAVVRFWFAK